MNQFADKEFLEKNAEDLIELGMAEYQPVIKWKPHADQTEQKAVYTTYITAETVLQALVNYKKVTDKTIEDLNQRIYELELAE